MIDKLTAGDTLNFLTAGGDYLASAEWSLVYKLIPRTAGPAVITLTSTAEGDDHRVTASNSTTASWAAGTYSWACYATKSGERQTLQTGVTEILADPAGATVLDTRSAAAIALDNITATLEGRATNAVAEYEIAGRRLKNIPVAELITLKSHMRTEVAREDAARRVAMGLPDPRRVYVRFG